MSQEDKINLEILFAQIQAAADTTDMLTGVFKQTTKRYFKALQKEAHRLQKEIDKKYVGTLHEDKMAEMVDLFHETGNDIRDIYKKTIADREGN